jgi:hypothetical protein
LEEWLYGENPREEEGGDREIGVAGGQRGI